jgi:acetyl-CoA C-acetyltransferase
VAEAYLVDIVRTPVGRKKGALSQVHPADLGAHVITALFDRNPSADPDAVDDVIFGCTDTLGPQSGDIARTCWLATGFAEHVPGVTVDRQCGSSQQAVHFAAQAVMSGTADLVVAGGVQNMTMIPISSAMMFGQQLGFETPFSGSVGWEKRFGDPTVNQVSQFRAADMIAEKWDISREDMERYALESHRRAGVAIDEGRFEREIVPLGEFAVDEGPRRDTTLEKMAELKTLREGGRITAAVSSQISDAASAALVASAAAVQRFGLTPRARVHHISVRADDPIFMLTAPIRAT